MRRKEASEQRHEKTELLKNTMKICIEKSLQNILQKMNYLDLLPDDVLKIINHKVQKLQIIYKKAERKENKRIQREKKQIADNKRKVYKKK